MKAMTEADMLKRMAAYCSSAERCRQDVEKKILTAGLPPEASERILRRLGEEGFLDERRFARSFVSDKFRFNKWGRRRIAYELAQKGIASEVAGEALDAIGPEAYKALLYDLLEAKKKTLKGEDPVA
ncbi:MAG: RecX family transcriptional regulator, partial [Tannerella sp.]|nr:RecX family transcriptional regulator [Tannerella sp.]